MSRISCSPERKTRMSPGPSRSSSPIASVMAVTWSRSSSLSLSSCGIVDRPVPDLDRVSAAGDLDDRGGLAGARVLEVLGEALGVDRRGGDDHLEVGAAGQQLPEVAEDEVDIQAALVRLVDDEGVVAVQVPVGADLGEQDAVGHELDGGGVAGFISKSDLVSDYVTQLSAQLLRDALRDRAGGDAPGLRVADLAGDPPAEFQADLGQLRGLPRPGLACHDHYLVITNSRRDVVPALADRQLFRVADGRARDGGLTRGRARRGARHRYPRLFIGHAVFTGHTARGTGGRPLRG